MARKYQVPGAQLAIHRDGHTAATEIGELEYGSGRPVSRAAAFPIGSISKTFTASLAMILVADGDLELDTPVSDYLPELRERGARLTLRQLLSHTGGLPSGPDTEDVSAASVRRYVLDHCRGQELVLAPGTGFSYSNMGYVMVGRLIETITGMGWWEAMESILLRPLDIEPTLIEGLGSGPAGRAIASGHSVNAQLGRPRPVRQNIAPAEAPTGALAVSAMDLVRLGRLHVGAGIPDLLPPAYAAQMRQPVPMAEPVGLAEGWGLGMAVFEEGGTRWVGHDGNADGTSCHLRIDPAGGWVVALTTNANTGTGLWGELLAELGAAEIPIGRSHAEPSRARPVTPPADCAGTYANGDMEYVVTTGDGGSVCLAVDGDAPAPLTCYEGLVFSLRDPATDRQVLGGRFLRDPRTGKVDGIQVGGRVARVMAHSSRR